MSEQKHTPGPWAVEIGAFDDAHHCYTPVVTAEARDIATLETAHGDALANARRIVACINACEGISTADLESGAVKAREILAAHYKKQRDELLDLLTLALPYIEDAEKDPAYKPGHVAKLTRRIRAAVEGNQ